MWGVGSRSPAAWSAREIELQALATLATLAQISTPSTAHFLKSHQLLVQKFAADRDRQRSSFKSFRAHFSWAVDIPRRGCVPVTRSKRKDQRTGFTAIRTRSLNDPHRGSLWGSTGTGRCRESAPRVKRRKAAQRLFGNEALTVKPVTPLSPPPRDTRQGATDDPSPSAQEFRFLLNELAAAELRRMFCSDEGAYVLGFEVAAPHC
jgi:hypothetical protein